ncbi:hypothetical protein RUESEDTHA_03475 [Ruegeria sp. THAF57]|uniref:hypothetical protein n=1 Tax=Ruegeria sp. THAF57 TaxID=2744555 RepID=UPI0015DEE016|nr:hypothetical protein [Ruegeria sp. THAF57]CAD0186566.1 hypothetical protein RUESEDTHA_03475 [Ruegeria sp. THAF57]
MKRNDLSGLIQITEAVFQREYQTLRPVLDAEARVQKQLARLDDQVQQTRKTATRSDGYQATGADVVWNSWEATTRRDLNIELARIRSQKLSAMEALREAFGRKRAIADLSDSLALERRRSAFKEQT